MPSDRHLGRYRLGERIAQGSVGDVYLAQATGAEGFRKTVVIKRIRPALAMQPDVRGIFDAEARIAQRLHHGNIVQILDYGIEGDSPYLVMEYVDGLALARLPRPSIQLGDALLIVEELASALGYAHRLEDERGRPLGVVHRDVTPNNILISREGVVKLADFGIAKIVGMPSRTAPGTIKGTVGYMAPEQAAGGAVDGRTDQFAAGVILYELLSGRTARDDVSNLAQACAQAMQPLPALRPHGEIDAELAAIVARATAIRPDARYPSMEELHGHLESWRVRRRIRASPLELSRAVKRARAQEPDLAPRRLDDAILKGLPNAETVPATPRVRRRLRRLWLLPAGLAVIGLLLGTMRFLGRKHDVSARTRSRPQPLDAASPPPAAPRAASAPPAAPAAPVGPAVAAQPTLSPAPPVTRPRSPVPASSPAVKPHLPKPPEPGRLKINLLPWARVSLDGQPLGSTPIDLEVPAGRHQVLLENPDLDRREARAVQVAPGQETRITSW